MNETVTLLKKAKKVLVKNKWTKGTFARKANGQTICLVTDPQAKCFCALGAISKVGIEAGLDISIQTRATLILGSVVDLGVASFNDAPQTTKKDVLKAFDAAIKLARKG